MRFLMIYNGDETTPPTPEKMAAIGKFGEEQTKAGVLLEMGGIVKTSKATRVKLAGGKFSVTDGPFPETKELIAGYAIVQARSMEEAIEHSRRFMQIAGDGDSEILQLYAPGDFH